MLSCSPEVCSIVDLRVLVSTLLINLCNLLFDMNVDCVESCNVCYVLLLHCMLCLLCRSFVINNQFDEDTFFYDTDFLHNVFFLDL